MALSSSTLAAGIEAMPLTLDENEVINGLVSAWENYFGESTVSGITATPGSFDAGLSAMQSALVGISTPGSGATVLAAGVSAFWTGIASLATSIWITSPIVLVPPIVPPTGLAELAAAITAAGNANLAAKASQSDAAATIAAAIHTNGGLGALVPGSVPPATPAPLSIL